eukprot:SAG11_NODE_803_length_7098_cov_10.219174_1_plen_50_part_00
MRREGTALAKHATRLAYAPMPWALAISSHPRIISPVHHLIRAISYTSDT